MEHKGRAVEGKGGQKKQNGESDESTGLSGMGNCIPKEEPPESKPLGLAQAKPSFDAEQMEMFDDPKTQQTSEVSATALIHSLHSLSILSPGPMDQEIGKKMEDAQTVRPRAHKYVLCSERHD